jgi:hypothetical protein
MVTGLRENHNAIATDLAVKTMPIKKKERKKERKKKKKNNITEQNEKKRNKTKQ